MKDFNIAEAAGGVGKALIKEFFANVSDSSNLEIRFYWAGKGTTIIPKNGVYGPLVSAISVDRGMLYTLVNYEDPRIHKVYKFTSYFSHCQLTS